MTHFLLAYAGTAIAFVLIDFIWLAVIARSFYRGGIGHLLRTDVNLVAALAFYLIYILGVVIFAVIPALQSGTWVTAFAYGGLLGFFCYATYDLTNLATIKGWPVSIALVDLSWGTILTGVSALMGYVFARAWQ